MQHRPKKRFGQNFLQNQAIINSILQIIRPKPDDNMVEIGPGLCALTAPLLSILNVLTVIEIDKDLQEELKNRPEFNNKLYLIASDALKVDYSQFGNNLRLVGNLPYNISTPLLIKLLQYTAYIRDMHFMLQKEVVDRIVAEPGSKSYGRLTVMIQCYYDTDSVLDVPPDAFYPKPKVDSAILRLTPKENENIINQVNFKSFEKTVATAFSMRRKTLANNLKPLMSAQDLLSIGIDPKQRPEQISINDYLRIEKFLSK